MGKTRALRSWFALFVVLALALAACGSEDADDGDDDAADDATEETEEDTEEPDEGADTEEPTEAEATEEPTESEPFEIQVGTFSVAVNYWCLYAAEDEGYFEEENVVLLEPLVFFADDELGRAIFSGDVNIGYAGLTPLVPIEQGTVDDVVMIGSIGDPVFAFMAPPEIETIEDLRGQTVAIQPQDATAAIYATAALDAALGEGEWTPLHTSGGTGARVGAMKAGQAQAALSNSPAAEKMNADDPEVKLLAYARDLHPDTAYEVGALYAKRDWLEENHDGVVRFFRAQERGCEFLNDPANREGVEQGLIQRYDISPSLATAVYEEYLGPEADYHLTDIRLDEEKVQNLLDLVIEAGVMDGSLDLDSVIDHTFVDEAREGM